MYGDAVFSPWLNIWLLQWPHRHFIWTSPLNRVDAWPLHMTKSYSAVINESDGYVKPPLQLSRRFWPRVADCGVRPSSPTPPWSQHSPRRDRAEPQKMDFWDWSATVHDCLQRADEQFYELPWTLGETVLYIDPVGSICLAAVWPLPY